MWKEKFRIGVDVIDTQHQSLFEKTEELMKHFRESKDKQKCIDTILFLKGYAVQHFSDEEAYQMYINYEGFPAHQEEHKQFVQTVLAHEKAMVASDFADKDVQDFIATLSTWLLYHVTGSDMLIGKEARKSEVAKTHGDKVRTSICDILNKVASIEMDSIKSTEPQSKGGDDLIIEINLTGDVSGYVTFVIPRLFATNLVYAMMNFVPKIINEFEIAVLLEVMNLIGTSICSHFEKEGLNCEIGALLMAQRNKEHTPDEIIALDTGIGVIEADVALETAK